MIQKIIILLAVLVFFPVLVFPDCNEDCYNSECDIPGTCEIRCEDNICYYYDEEETCWQYDQNHGYYPCGCECYECDDSCFEDDDDCDHDDDDKLHVYYTCFIQVIK